MGQHFETEKMVLNTLHTAETPVPRSVKVSARARKVVVKGLHGVLKRDFGHAVVEIKSIVTRSGNQMVRVGCWSGSKKAKAVVQSICIEMKFVYAHFPINCNIAKDNKSIEIRNYIGSRNPLSTIMPHGTTVDRSDDKDTIVITGIDLDHVSQAAASIQQKCQVKNKDIRKFLDGVYVSKRDHIWDEED